tara:strand:- start:3510 stop:3728 length:219 start_codon:yes stop_codon:yes gene_type:complete
MRKEKKPDKYLRPQAIAAEALYSLNEVKLRLGIGDATLRKARREGLPVYRFGKCGFIHGTDLIDFLKKKNQD